MMGLANPYYLLGTVAALVPLLIFVCTRDRVRKVAFSTLRFFAGSSHTLLKRKRWHEMLLLAMRMALCALLAVAFARPLLKSPGGGDGAPMQAAHAVAVAVDVSASMARGGAFDRARQIVGKALDDLPGDAAVTLIAFDRAAGVEVPWTGDSAAVRERIAALAPGAGGTDIATAVRKADECLEQIASDDKQILLVSDLQRAGWEGFAGDWRLHRGVKLDVRPVEAEKTVDVAIVAADYPQSIVNDAAQHAITLRIANFSAQPVQDLPVRLAINDAPCETQKVNLAAGDNVVLRFRCRFDRVGDNRGVARIGEKDVETLGHTLCFNTRVAPKIEVRVLTAGKGGKEEKAAAFFLQTALAPSAESPFAVKRLTAPAATAADLASAAVVILADVDSVGPEVGKALGEVLHRGGGLLFLPGAGVKPATFARTFGDLAPCKLRRVVTAGEMRRGGTKAVLTKINFEHPVFEIFERPHFGDLSAVRFARYWEVIDSQLAKILSRFDDGRPYLIERPVGGGNSALLTSPVDAEWNDLPLRAVFLPFVHQIAGYLAQRVERPTAYRVGDVLTVPPQHSLREPSGQVHQGGSFRAERSGFHELLDASGSVVLAYAVNTDLTETNPATVDTAEVKAALEPVAGGTAEALAGIAGPDGHSGREIWAYLVAGLLLLTVVELFVSNRVARH